MNRDEDPLSKVFREYLATSYLFPYLRGTVHGSLSSMQSVCHMHIMSSVLTGDVDPFMADIHSAILADDPMQLARVCQEDVDLDERFSPSVNDMHAGMTPLALACALNKPKLAEVCVLVCVCGGVEGYVWVCMCVCE